MTSPLDQDFDRRLRQAHEAALQHLPSRTRAQLAVRNTTIARQRPSAARGPAWVLVSACAVGALALGLTWHLQSPPHTSAQSPSSGPPAVPDDTSADDVYALFDESPDLYLWLDSADATAALE